MLNSYRVNAHTFAPSHPLGVKPSGNAFLEENRAELVKQRVKVLGRLGGLSEEVLTYIISLVDDPKDLLSLGHASRVLYAYTYSEELWRKLYVDEFILLEEDKKDSREKVHPFGCKIWMGSWRKTVLHLETEALIKTNDLLFSDYLYRPYQCSQIDFEHLFRKVINIEKKSRGQGDALSGFGAERIDEEALTLNDFEGKYVNKPFILQNKKVNNRWPGWTLESLLERFGSVSFRQESVKWSLSFYADYFRQNCDESPLYLFDCNSEAIRQIQNEYEGPKIFQKDFFKVFQEGDIRCRPDHRWLIVGPRGSGSTFHKDPNQTCAWNAVLSGQKLWIMLPPDVKPPGVSTDINEEEVTSPVGVAEWVLSGFYNDAVRLAEDGKCVITVTFPGDCIYVPSGWWHTVINLTDSVALTENFVPRPTLPKTLHFFNHKRSQISGFHLRDTLSSTAQFLKTNEATDDEKSRSNFEKLEHFLSKYGGSKIDNKDCGLSETNADLPIYEFFVEILRASKNVAAKLIDALEKSSLLELEAAKEKQRSKVHVLKASETWTSLAAESSSGFSFGFAVE
ncbi:LAME_0E10352g1_1 [Lachancea meyersii CBS 8951]|uniref:LAME_0E10352g1_1 n=1 Tax=Lachancea meyersii CBS 8951 TaxID=1266667 RepID=A0A1G4JJY8_9SACH|nr:LAME_0E10352g1_1 [Lachancea meyersii CBS 8951]